MRKASYLAQSKGELVAGITADQTASGQHQDRLDTFLSALEKFKQENYAAAILDCEKALQLQDDDFWAITERPVPASDCAIGQTPKPN